MSVELENKDNDNVKLSIIEPKIKSQQSLINEQPSKLIDDTNANNAININAININDTTKINNISQEFGIMITLQENLNLRIGRERWKKYISTMFWYYVTMPINFTITLFTALSSGQVGTNANFLSETTLFAILFTSFLLSTINTFFKLKETTEANYQISQKFEQFAIQFQEIYFTPIKTNNDIYSRLIKYKKLQYDINEYCMNTKLDNINYLTEIIYSCCKAMCFRSRDKLINISERFWVLDGKKKCDTYNKKCLIVDTSNFLFDIENIADHDITQLSIKQLTSPDYVPTESHNTFKNLFNRNLTSLLSSSSSDTTSTQTNLTVDNSKTNSNNINNNITEWQYKNIENNKNNIIANKDSTDNKNDIIISNRLSKISINV